MATGPASTHAPTATQWFLVSAWVTIAINATAAGAASHTSGALETRLPPEGGAICGSGDSPETGAPPSGCAGGGALSHDPDEPAPLGEPPKSHDIQHPFLAPPPAG